MEEFRDAGVGCPSKLEVSTTISFFGFFSGFVHGSVSVLQLGEERAAVGQGVLCCFFLFPWLVFV